MPRLTIPALSLVASLLAGCSAQDPAAPQQAAIEAAATRAEAAAKRAEAAAGRAARYAANPAPVAAPAEPDPAAEVDESRPAPVADDGIVHPLTHG